MSSRASHVTASRLGSTLWLRTIHGPIRPYKGSSLPIACFTNVPSVYHLISLPIPAWHVADVSPPPPFLPLLSSSISTKAVACLCTFISSSYEPPTDTAIITTITTTITTTVTTTITTAIANKQLQPQPPSLVTITTPIAATGRLHLPDGS